MKDKLMLNRNEVIQGAAPECLEVLKSFDPKHASFYFDGYFGSVLRPKLSERFNIPEEQIVVGYGAEYFLRTIFDSLEANKDTVLTHELHYSFYNKYLAFKDIKLTEFKLIENENTFEFDIEDCLNKIKEINPKVVLITSPNNPTGNSIGAEDLSRILEQTNADSLVVLDETYCGFDKEYNEASFLSLINKYDNLLILRSFSKLYALAGMRIGFGLCGKKVKEILHYQDLYLGGSRILEEVAVAALDAKEYYEKLSQEIVADRDNFIEEVNKLNHFKAYISDANFVIVKVSPEVKTALEARLETEEVLVSKFVNEDYMRVTVGSTEHTNRFLEVLKEVN